MGFVGRVWHFASAYPVATISSVAFYALIIAAYVPRFRQHIVPRFNHPISPQQSFLSAMDAMRGFAATLVALGHCFYWTYPVFYKSQLRVPLLAYGAKAVPMFAILSGFLIYRSARRIKSDADVKHFVARRFFRIYPLYLLSVIVCLAMGQIVSDSKDVGSLSYFMAESMMLRALDFPQFANPVTWSLYVEVLFYAILPVYLMVIGSKRFLSVTFFVLVVLIVADQVPSRELHLWKYFVMGMIASELSLRHRELLQGVAGKIILAVGLALLLIDLVGPKTDWVAHMGLVKRNLAEYTIGLGLAFSLIAASISFVPLAGRLLDVFPIRFIGVVSYSIFIVHPFYLLVNFPELVLRKVGTQTEYFKTLEALPDWYLPVLFVPGIFAWAAVTFLLIEKPALVAGSRWMERRQTHEEPPRATPDAVVARSGS